MKRPLGLVVLMIIAVLNVPLEILIGVTTISDGPSYASVMGFILAAAMLAFVYGAWRANRWAWVLGMVIFGLALVGAIMSFWLDVLAVLSLIMATLAVVYLLQKPTRAYFYHS